MDPKWYNEFEGDEEERYELAVAASLRDQGINQDVAQDVDQDNDQDSDQDYGSLIDTRFQRQNSQANIYNTPTTQTANTSKKEESKQEKSKDPDEDLRWEIDISPDPEKKARTAEWNSHNNTQKDTKPVSHIKGPSPVRSTVTVSTPKVLTPKIETPKVPRSEISDLIATQDQEYLESLEFDKQKSSSSTMTDRDPEFRSRDTKYEEPELESKEEEPEELEQPIPMFSPEDSPIHLRFQYPGRKNVSHVFSSNEPLLTLVNQAKFDTKHRGNINFTMRPSGLIKADLSAPIGTLGIQDRSTLCVNYDD